MGKAVNIQMYNRLFGGSKKSKIDAVVCNSTVETYRANATIPSEVSVSWTSVSNKIEILSGANTSTMTCKVRVNNYGDETIKLNIQYGGKTYTAMRTVYVNYPHVTQVTGPTSPLSAGRGGVFHAFPVYDSSVCEYVWRVEPSYGVSHSRWQNTNEITFSQPGEYTVYCQAYTARCGSAGSEAYTSVGVSSYYNTYTTPSSRMVTITPSTLETNQTTGAASSSAAKTVTTNVPYQLINSITGVIAATGTFPREGGTLDFSSLSGGVYVLTIQVTDGIMDTHKLVLK